MAKNQGIYNEYKARREKDEANAKIVEKFVDKIYEENGMKIVRIDDEFIQKHGVDLVYFREDKPVCVDEKFAINYRHCDLQSFVFELYAKNNKNKEGWFLSNYMIAEYYGLLWFRSDEDITEITSYDLCYIKKEKIKEYLKTVGFYDGIVQDFINHWKSGNETITDNKFYVRDGKRYMNLKRGVRIVQSTKFKAENPINVVIPKKELLKMADFCFHK